MPSDAAPVDMLPTELLAQICEYLAEEPPSSSRLHDQPDAQMLKSSRQNLKNFSLVSRRWRAISLAILFRHVHWSLDRWELLLVEPRQIADPISAMPLLAFLRENDLGRHVESLTLCVSDSMHGMWRLAEAGLAPDTTSFTTARNILGRDLADADPAHISLVDSRPDSGAVGQRHPNIATRAATHFEDNNWVWETIFRLTDPLRFTIMASPQMLASLLSRMLFLGDSWSFKTQFHILSLSRDSRELGARADGQTHSSVSPGSDPAAPRADSQPRAEPSSSSTCDQGSKRIPCNLLTMRPWTSLLVNEGSSMRVYKTYEFFHKRPPSILGALLGSEEFPNDVPLLPPTVVSFSYVAIFPLSSHFNTLVRALPPINKLFVQLVPRNDILQDPDEMRHVVASDLWLERNSCYSMVMRELLSSAMHGEAGEEFFDETAGPSGVYARNWRNLREFESGDAADKDAWDMAVQYVQVSRTGWRVERDGVFVKGPRPDSAHPGSGSGSLDEDESAAGGGAIDIL